MTTKGERVINGFIGLWLLAWAAAAVMSVAGIWSGDTRWVQTAWVALGVGLFFFVMALFGSWAEDSSKSDKPTGT